MSFHLGRVLYSCMIFLSSEHFKYNNDLYFVTTVESVGGDIFTSSPVSDILLNISGKSSN